jgi:hypothetical protein
MVGANDVDEIIFMHIQSFVLEYYIKWYKVGKHPDIGNPNDITFRMYNDIGDWSRSKSYN